LKPIKKLITIKQFSKHYKNKTIKLNDMSIGEGVTVLKGENGSGKSTLLKAIMNLIHYEGVILHNLEIGYCPEVAINISRITCQQLIDVSIKNVYDQGVDLIKLFDIKPLLKKRFITCSKGEQQRIRLVMTLLNRRDIYLLDEPFSGLSSLYQSRFKYWIKSAKTPLVISTHQTHLDELATQVIYV
jgi:ABC-2 type transport system ATP-binding protein